MKKKSRATTAKSIFKAILFCVVFIGLFVFLSFSKGFVADKFERIAHGMIGTCAAIFTTFIFVKFDKINFADIGLKFERISVKRFLLGVLAGIALMGILSMSVITYSNFKIEHNSNSNFLSFLFYTLPLIPLAFMEEIAFRGYPLRKLKEQTGVRYAIIITSLLFGIYHIANGWTIQNSFLGAGVWGIIYGIAAVYSNGIAMPTGLHYAANLTTAAFGITPGPSNIWILTSKDGLSLDNYQSSQFITIIPQISLFIFGIFLMEWLIKRNTKANLDIAATVL